MGTITDLSNFIDPTSLGTSPTTYLWAGGADYTFPKPVRFLRASTAGNIKYVDGAGAQVVAAFLAGETRALAAVSIVNTGTTCTGVEGMP